MSDEELPYAKEAQEQFEKVSKNWPAGELGRAAYGGSTYIDCERWFQYTFQPTIDESKLTEQQKMEFKMPFFVEITIWIGVDPEKAFETMKQGMLEKGPDNFKEWPSGYPDHGNDYEFVSHCGADKNESQVVFTQGKKKWSLILVGKSSDDDTLVQYADGAWQVVEGLGLCR